MNTRNLAWVVVVVLIALAATAACEQGSPVDPVTTKATKATAGPILSAAANEANASKILYACYNPSGAVYRIKEPGLPDGCRAQDVEFSWNEQGPEGPPGPAGADGVSGWELKSATWTLTSAFQSISISCTPGKKVLGGGYSPFADVPGNRYVSIFASFPSPVLQDAWIVGFRVESDGLGTKWNVWAICAFVSE